MKIVQKIKLDFPEVEIVKMESSQNQEVNESNYNDAVKDDRVSVTLKNVVAPPKKLQIKESQVGSHPNSSTSADQQEFLKMLYINGMHDTTTNVEDYTQTDSSQQSPNQNPLQIQSILHLKTYEEMFQRRLNEARFREQKIPQVAIQKLVKIEMDDYIGKSFKKNLNLVSQMKSISAQQTNELKPKSPVIHSGSLCDNCGVSPIIGPKFTCLFCDNFELCEQCEYLSQLQGSAIHDNDHPLIKVKTPMSIKLEKSGEKVIISHS